MKNIQRELSILAGNINPVKIRFALFLLTLVLFVVMAGAPETGGTIFRH
jgi:hypothetical protein